MRLPLRLRIQFRRRTHLGAALTLAISAGQVWSQQLIGYVNTRDAEVTGASDVLKGQAVLTGSAAVMARDHTATITLGRGGMVRVCQSSALHMTQSKSAITAAPLLFSLDRGAIEIEMAGTPNDALMTPDLRFTVVKAGPLDLRVRVARSGDTCVENRGASAPTLNISDPFGETMYQVAAGQHVLFEHGNLHEVVDHEAEPCGCPDAQGLALADALLAAGGADAKPSIPGKPAEAHPFPAAISEGLASPAEVPQAPTGEVHMQIADTLSYSAAGSGAAPTSGEKGPPAATASTAPAGGAEPASAPQRHGPIYAVGRFFKRIFGG